MNSPRQTSMSIVFETSRHSPFMGDDSYPHIADDDRFDRSEDGHTSAMNDVSVADVNELAAVADYQAPEATILADSEPARLIVPEVPSDDSEHREDSPPATIAATAAAASAAARTRVKRKTAKRRKSSVSSVSSLPSHTANASAEGKQSSSITKPERNVRRNARGMIPCAWPDCNDEVREFARKCEYNKHMDKHERPYCCTAVGCEQLPGFTYSGGLLRHEREVHYKHGGPRNPLRCPHISCKRHAGKGFSRQENLNEHLRRVHTSAGAAANGADLGDAAHGNHAYLAFQVIRPLTSDNNVSVLAGSPSAVASTVSVAPENLTSLAVPTVAHDDGKTLGHADLTTPTQQAQIAPRPSKRTSSLISGDDDGKSDDDQENLREGIKRVRQENTKLKQQADEQRTQIKDMMQQLVELREQLQATQLQQQKQQQRQEEAEQLQRDQQTNVKADLEVVL